MLKVIIENNQEVIKRQIEALKYSLSTDKSEKDKIIHSEVLRTLEIRLEQLVKANQSNEKHKLPYFLIDDRIQGVITSLVSKCVELKLDNFSFQLYLLSQEIFFYLSEFNSYWELTVTTKKREAQKRLEYRDIYRLYDGKELVYGCLERDY